MLRTTRRTDGPLTNGEPKSKSDYLKPLQVSRNPQRTRKNHLYAPQYREQSSPTPFANFDYSEGDELKDATTPLLTSN
jgi:hypothetical protein